MSETQWISKHDLPDDEYHADHSRISATMVKAFDASPKKYRRVYIDGEQEDRKAKSIIDVGSLIHSGALEGVPVRSACLKYPESCLRKDGGLNPRPAAQFREDNPGMYCLKEDDYLAVRSAIVAFEQSYLAGWRDAAKKNGHCEEALFTDHEDFDLPLRCKPDMVFVSGDTVNVVDLKCTDPHPAAFRRHLKLMRAWVQLSHYRYCVAKAYDVPVERVEFYFAAIRPVADFEISTIRLGDELKDRSFDRWEERLGNLKEAVDTGVWLSPWEENIQTVDSLYFD